jgi:hypothetical protein
MTETIAFDVLNVACSLIVFCIASYKLIWRPRAFTWVERIGLGLLAAGCIMTIGPLTHKPSPFDDWSIALFRIGCAVYFIGRLTRHKLNNALARKQALRSLRERTR